MSNRSENAIAQSNRINEKATMIGQINTAITEYKQREGCDIESAVRDALVEMRHICDAYGLCLGDIDRNAQSLYREELTWRYGN